MNAFRSRLPGDRLEEAFAEAKPLFSISEAAVAANRCLFCHDAPCVAHCPTAIDVPAFIRQIASGNTRGSARTILRSNLLGASCARACPVEVLCEGACVFTTAGQEPVEIGRLQRYAMHDGAPSVALARERSTGRSVGLVGAGPASLACAGTLALAGHDAVVYEARELAGGLGTHGVAPYKLRADDALEEVAFIASLGVTFRTGVTVGRELAAGELLDRHDALFLGIGLGDDGRLGVSGEDGPGVEGAVAWIRRMKTSPRASTLPFTRAIVVGGGNTAIDAARELAELGANAVTLVYRRTEADMPAYRHEVAHAKEAGVVLLERSAVAAIERASGNVSAVRIVETDGGRPTPRERGVWPADLVLVAIGQTKLRELASAFEGVACDGDGRIVVDRATYATGNPRIFAGGDAVSGGLEIVHAARDGQAAARAIDACLASIPRRSASHG